MGVNDLKINKFKKKSFFKNIKLVKKVTSLVAVSLVSVMIFTGCYSTKRNVKSSNVESSYTQSYNDYRTYSTKTDDFDYSKYNIKISENEYNDFISYLDNYNTEYTYDEYYKVDEALKEYENIKDKKVEKHEFHMDDITLENIYNTVKKNNENYSSNDENKYQNLFLEEFSDSELREICEIINDTIQKYIKDGKISDIDEFKCILGDLKVFRKKDITNAYVSDDNCMIICPKMISTLKIKAKSKDQDLLKDVVSHETIHLMQKSCVDTLKIKYNIGNSIKFSNMDIHPLYWKWFYEGVAEKYSMKFTGDSATTYEYYINYIDSLSFSTILFKNNNVESIPDTTLNKDLYNLFKIFNVDNKEEQKEIVNMMFSLDILETSNEEFMNKYNPNISTDERTELRKNLKSSICQTMAKYFYKSLNELVKNNDLKLNDIFYLITLYESDLDTHITYSDPNEASSFKDFLNSYINLQDQFFNVLASSQKISQDEIKERFKSYEIKTSAGKENYNMSFLSKEKQDFLNNYKQKYEKQEHVRIMDVVNQKTNVK